MNHKNWQKILSALGGDTVKEMEAMGEDELKQTILSANSAMEGMTNEIEKNKKYQDIKEQKTALESGKKEVDRRQKAKIKFALYLLEEKGKVPSYEVKEQDSEDEAG